MLLLLTKRKLKWAASGRGTPLSLTLAKWLVTDGEHLAEGTSEGFFQRPRAGLGCFLWLRRTLLMCCLKEGSSTALHGVWMCGVELTRGGGGTWLCGRQKQQGTFPGEMVLMLRV